MVEQTKNPKLIEAEENVAEAKRVLGISAPRLADKLLSVTQGNASLVKELMADVANIAGNTGILAVAERRLDAEKYPVDSEHGYMNPDLKDPQSESRKYGVSAAHKIVNISINFGKEKEKKG